MLAIVVTCQLVPVSEPLHFRGIVARGLANPAFPRIHQGRDFTDPPVPERGAAALDQAEKDLTNPFVVACIAARPGDEDSSTLVYCRRKLGAYTVAVFATRGDPSEDEAGAVSREEAGVSRTSQSLEVAEAEGADVYFLNLPNQPAEQAAEDASAAWEKKDGLLSIVRFIRAIHPDVIITGGESSSGDQAQLAVERLAVRAVDSASDPGQFAEAGSAWAVKRLYFRATQTNSNASVNVGELDAIRGFSYAGLAEAARGFYKTGHRHDIVDTVYYRLERPIEKPAGDTGRSILGGLSIPKIVEEEISIPALTTAGSLAVTDRRQLAQALNGKLYVMRSGGSGEDLRERFGADYFRIERFMRCLEKAIASALGLELEVQLAGQAVIPGQKFRVKLRFTNGSDGPLAVEFQTPAGFPSPGSASPTFKADLTNCEGGHSITRDYEYQVPKTTPPTVPHSSHLYDSSFFPVGDGRSPSSRPFGLAFPTGVRVNAGIGGISLQAITTIDVVPPFELSVTPAAALLKDFGTVRSVDFIARVINHTPGPFAAELWVVPLAVTKDDYKPIRVKFSGEDEKLDVPVRLQVPLLKPPLATSVLLELRRPRPAPPAALASFKINVRVGGLAAPEDLNIGYISKVANAADSRVAEAIRQLGCRHEFLPIENLRFADGARDLKRFDSIIVDRDAYRDLPELVMLNNKLLDYVRGGGNLIVMSQRADAWNGVPGLAPFPIRLSREATNVQLNVARIADDEAIVLAQPNKIAAGDLADWPVERKIYLPDAWDKQYQPVIVYAPGDSAPVRSVLLFAAVGQGTYIYFAVGAGEAIKDMNAGAYRLITNLLSLPRYNTRVRRQNLDKIRAK